MIKFLRFQKAIRSPVQTRQFVLVALLWLLFWSAATVYGQEHKKVQVPSITLAKQAATQAKKPVKMLDGLLIQHYSWLGGDVEIAVTPQFLRISSPTSSAVTVSKAPFKTVVAYDSGKKTYYETKPEAAGSFMIQRFLRILGGDPHPKKWKKVEDGMIAGVKAGRYVADNAGSPEKHFTDKGEKIISEMRNSGFWAAENLDIPPGAADIVLKMEGFPGIHKLPLRFDWPKSKPAVKHKVNTYSVKKTSFAPEKFQVPSGYHKAGAEYSLQSEELELFGGGDPTGLSKEKK